jgi:DNA-binding transcriptional MerR regulator
MPIKETNTEGKLYYSIGEVAKMLNLTASQIRFWESEFPHLRPKTNTKGDRRYRNSDIDQIKIIQRLVKDQGYTLQGAKEYLEKKKNVKSKEAVKQLKRIREFLLELREILVKELPPQSGPSLFD